MLSSNQRALAAGCALVFIAIVAVIAVGGSWYYINFVATDDEEVAVNPVETKKVDKQDVEEEETVFSGEERDWTDVQGRTINGTLITANSKEALVRVSRNQRLYRIPREKLSGADNTFLTKWVDQNPEADQYPPIPSFWPTFYDGRTVEHKIVRAPGKDDWTVYRTKNYEIRSDSNIDGEILNGFVLICESIDNAMRRLPLPLLWGREDDAERIVYIYENRKNYLNGGGMEHAAGHFDPETNEVHLRLDELTDVDMRRFFGQYTLKKRNQYNLIVHELVHQANYGLIATGGAAWLPEGLSEYMTAMQKPPGRFTFHKTQQAVREHITNSLAFDGLVEVETLRILNLSKFLSMPIQDFNKGSASSSGTAFSYYSGSLILTEFFCHGDDNSLRSFMEAVLTGVDEKEALETHLLRGRTKEQIQQLIIDRWKPNGLTIHFESNPRIQKGDFRGEVGLESAISSFRRGL